MLHQTWHPSWLSPVPVFRYLHPLRCHQGMTASYRPLLLEKKVRSNDTISDSTRKQWPANCTLLDLTRLYYYLVTFICYYYFTLYFQWQKHLLNTKMGHPVPFLSSSRNNTRSERDGWQRRFNMWILCIAYGCCRQFLCHDVVFELAAFPILIFLLECVKGDWKF